MQDPVITSPGDLFRQMAFCISASAANVVRSVSTSSDRGRPTCWSPVMRTRSADCRSESPSFMRATAPCPSGVERLISAPSFDPAQTPCAFQSQGGTSTPVAQRCHSATAQAPSYSFQNSGVVSGYTTPRQMSPAVSPSMPPGHATPRQCRPLNGFAQPVVITSTVPAQSVTVVRSPKPSSPRGQAKPLEKAAERAAPVAVVTSPTWTPRSSFREARHVKQPELRAMPVASVQASFLDVEEQLKEARATLDLRGKTILELETANLELQQELAIKDQKIEDLTKTIEDLQARLRVQPTSYLEKNWISANPEDKYPCFNTSCKLDTHDHSNLPEEERLIPESPRVSMPNSPVFGDNIALGDDSIDVQIQAYLKENPDWNLEVHKIRTGWYQFGWPVGKRAFMKLSGKGTVVVRTGGGYKGLRKYLDEYRLDGLGDEKVVDQAKRHWNTMKGVARMITNGATGQRMYEARCSTDPV